MWPPSPSVEDEATSLAREHGLDAVIQNLKADYPPADSRGAVDQYPIIVDNDSNNEKPNVEEKKHQKHVRFPPDGQSSDESSGPATPPPTHRESRYVVVPSSLTEQKKDSPRKVNVRSKSTTRTEGETTPRGRPQVSRIQTDLGNDLQGAITGQRRAPSPYSYRAPPSAQSFSNQQPPKPTLLTPAATATATATPSAGEVDHRRSRSAHPERKSTLVDSSDSDHRSYRRHRSKSRGDRHKSHHSSSDEVSRSSHSHKSHSHHSRSEISPPREKRAAPSHRPAHSRITPPISPIVSRESPYTSATEDHERHRAAATRHHERRLSKDSPYTSSAEESYRMKGAEDKLRGLASRRMSLHRKDKPRIDLSDQRSPYIDEKLREKTEDHLNHKAGDRVKYGLDTPLSLPARTPRGMEDFDKAFEENRKRHSRHVSHHSVNGSPYSSPPGSPPRTPRVERRSKDYFDLASSGTLPPKHRSRPPSIDEGVLKDMKPMTTLLGAATLGATIAAKHAPPLSRSSTASLETPPSGSQSRNTSGQRPKKSPTLYEEGPPLSRTGPVTPRDEPISRRPIAHPTREHRPVSRDGSVVDHNDFASHRPPTHTSREERPVSRAGSLSGRDEPVVPRTPTRPTREERPVSRDGPSSPFEQLRPIQRSFSHTSISENPQLRPSATYRVYSTTTSSLHPPTAGHASHLGPSPLTKVTHSSPASSERVPSLASFSQPRTFTLPSCPNTQPVTGLHHWYTVQGIPGFNVCSSCMSTLGSSPFRDHFVPSPYKPPTEAIACAMGKPWIRIAVMRSLKEGRANVQLLEGLSKRPEAVSPCPGIKTDVRRWFHLVDPVTKKPVPNFDVCTACLRSVDLIFPELKRTIFERPDDKLFQEKTCSMNTGSKHFQSLINELERLASYVRNNDLRTKDIQAFADFARKISRYRECCKDSMLPLQAWHYIPDLPEFTVCEECFEEVVWPLKDKLIARDVSKTTKLVPLPRRDQYFPGISCQLYSERMRKVFKDSVTRNDFEGLRQAARKRYDMEHRLHEIQRLYEQDQKVGIDRRAEIERNKALWKNYE